MPGDKEQHRTCSQPGCATQLSRFNKGRYCSVCERKHPPVAAGSFTGSPRGQQAHKRPLVPATPKERPDSPIDDADLEKLAESTWIEATGDGERVRLDLRMGTNVILARCYISNAKAKDLAFLLIRVSG